MKQIEDCSSDSDTENIEGLFQQSSVVSETLVGSPENYILDIAATLESEPNIALSISENPCQVYHLSNQNFAKIANLEEDEELIAELKFSRDNSNILYTACSDGTIRVWDLRTPQKSTLQFIDTTISTVEKPKLGRKTVNCFDVSPNQRLLVAGTDLLDGDAYMLFWDIRKNALLGAYWESHTGDISQVRFHPTDSNTVISGSLDGLINVYDLTEEKEDDALRDCYNTESSVEKLYWFEAGYNDTIACTTHTADVQFWHMDDAAPFADLKRGEIAKAIKRTNEDHLYTIGVHGSYPNNFILAGSNYGEGEIVRAVNCKKKKITPLCNFPNNKQRIRASWFNPNTNLLLTGGEKGVLNAWTIPCL